MLLMEPHVQTTQWFISQAAHSGGVMGEEVGVGDRGAAVVCEVGADGQHTTSGRGAGPPEPFGVVTVV